MLTLLGLLVGGFSCKERSDTNGSAANATPDAAALPKTTLTLNGEDFCVELAFTRQSRARGLMFREGLPLNNGMLFVFDRPKPRWFHMNNCLIDLDLVFIGPDGTIAKTVAMTAPATGEPTKYYPSDVSIQYALELAAGTCARLRLTKDQSIRLPPDVLHLDAEPD